MRPVVLVDCDGVLADFTQATLDGVLKVSGRKYDRSDVTTWEIFDSLAETEDTKGAVYGLLKGRGGCLGIPVLPGAVDGIQTLSNVADIIVVTSPFRGSETWVHERGLWLEKYFGSAISGVIHTRHKERVHGDIFIDDREANVQAWCDYWKYRDPKCIGVTWARNSELDPAVRWATVLNLLQLGAK